MQNFKIIISLLIISALSFLILSLKLAEVPNGLYVDEAATGVNAYSILKTGKDEYGKEFPLAFRFFGSYSPPLYVYLTSIPISYFGLNEFSVRIVSVILGGLMILVLFGFFKQNYLINQKIIFLLLILFTLTPWNFFFARTGYELYLGFFLFSLGCLFCTIGLKRKMYLILGLSIFSLSTYASHPQMFSVPFFIPGFIYLFWKRIDKKSLIVGLILTFFIQIPHLTLLGTQALINKSDLFYSGEVITNAQKIFLPDILSVPLSFGFSFLSRLITYFSPHSLFFFPDPDPQRSIPEISVFYSWMVIPFLIGMYILFKNPRQDFVKLLILLAVVSVLPASLTKDPFSTQRALNLLLPFFIVICIGLSYIAEKAGYRKFIGLFVVLLFVSGILLWRSYFVLLPAENGVAWNYGFKKLAKFISQNPDKQFVVENVGDKPSYIELAFFLQLDPSLLQKAVDPSFRQNYYNLNQFNSYYKFENIQTRKLKWEEDIYKIQILVGNELSISPQQAQEHFLEEILRINDPRGYPIFIGFLTNPEKKCRETNFKSNLCR